MNTSTEGSLIFGVLLVVCVAIIAGIVRAAQRPRPPRAEGSADAPAGETPWEVCQAQLKDAPPLSISAEDGEAPAGETPREACQAQPEDAPPLPISAEDGEAPSPQHSNAAIRKRAWMLFRRHYKALLPIAAAVALLTEATGFVADLFVDSATLQLLIGAFAIVLFAPVASIGAASTALRVWRGEEPRLRYLLDFATSRARLFKAWGLAALLRVVLGSLAGLEMLLASFGNGAPGAIGMFIALAMLAMIAVDIWLTLRLELLYFTLARNPQGKITALFAAAFRATKHKIGRIIGMYAFCSWPYLIPSFAGLLLMRSGGAYAFVWACALWLLFRTFYGGYVLLSWAGLAEELLGAESDTP